MAAIYNLIKAIIPIHNAVAVPVTSSVTVAFLSPMQASSLNSNTVILEVVNGAVVPAAYSYDFLSQELTIDPTLSLEGDTQYQLKILSGDAGPKTITADTSSREYAFAFTTEVLVVVEPPIEEPPVENPPLEPIVDAPSLLLVENYPQNGTLLPTPERVFVRFNEPVETANVLLNTKLQLDTGNSLLSLLGGQTAHTLTVESFGTGGMYYVVFTISPALEAGKAYQLVLDSNLTAVSGSRLNEEIVIRFQTEWTQYFTTTRSVRLLMGRFSEAYSDLELAEMIHEHSVSAYQLVSMSTSFKEEDWAPAPYAASQYVLYRTAYTAMLNQALESSSGIKKNFQLGDLQVSESTSVSSEISNLLSLFEKEMNRWWSLLYGAEAVIDDGIYRPVLSKALGSATKSETDYAYPTFLTRASFAELGG